MTIAGESGAKTGRARPVKHSFAIRGHRTSISLEAEFWDALREAAAAEGVGLSALVARIDQDRGAAGLSSAVRVWVLDYFRRRTGPD
jgi:predicted DNA-binding ribbon-helix-helix protein